MPPALQLKPQDLDSTEKRSKISVAVVGCGHKGIFYANAFADAGFRVICTDADASVVKKLAKGKASFAAPEMEAKLKSHVTAERICAEGDLKKAVSQCDVVVVAINGVVDEQKINGDNGLVGTCKQVGSALQQGSLVVYGGVAALGFMEGAIKETLENTSGLKAGEQFGLAYSPLTSTSVNMALQVAAADKNSLASATALLKTLTANVTETGDVKAAEVAVLFRLAKQDTDIALANEMAMFCESANVDCFSVLNLLSQDHPDFYPAVAEDNCAQAHLLLEAAENLNAKVKLPALARQINEDMIKHAVNLTADALRCGDKTLRRGKVAVLGSASPKSATAAYVKMLEQKGAKVSLYDPAARREPLDARVVKRSLNETVEGTDCIVLLSNPDQLGRLNLKKIKVLMKSPSVMVDLVGKFEPAHVETEGFIYAGLGRRVEKK
ncbi:MAG: 3-hydroxyacyl-CoA dehydrogenase NAD-binding domain-containing protein [Candidatus Bathyarchaeota archaeon]|nr:3-hydroxyacyl-CoA dehydrogenase NAD-binding domain-containing protein [Candidatus Bathyarchaeota archaeon]